MALAIVFLLRCRTFLFFLLPLFFLSGCATEDFDPAKAPEFLVQSDYASFYKLGPGQSRGPDASLQRGEMLKVLRREFGYSYVEIADGRTGYIANEEISPAPQIHHAETAAPVGKRSSRRHAERSSDESGVPFSMPEIEVLPQPVDVLHPISEIEPATDSKPDFRY